MSDAINQAVADSVQKLSEVAPTAVLTNCLLWTGVAFITIIGFNILRPNIIYEPKAKYHTGGKTPPKISDGFFSWLPPLIHTKEPELLDKVGLDAITFLRFLRMMRWLFFGLSLVLVAMTIPVNVTQGLKLKPNKRDALSILTIRDVNGRYLYIHIAAVYVVTFMVFGAVWYHWRAMVRLRTQWFESDEYQKSFYARTLMITDVPKKLHSDQGLTQLLQQLQIPYPATAVHIGRKVGKLPELVDYHNEAVRELETHLVRYLKGGKIGKKRPTITQGGCLGMGGQKRDAIDHYTAKLKKTEAAIEQWRNDIDLRRAENYGFASLAAVPYAHIVARKMAGKTAKGTTVTMAPNPKDIIWENLNMTPAERTSKRMMGFVWLAVVAFLNTIPLLIISFLANLTSLQAYIPALSDWSGKNPRLASLASSILPPTISAIFGYALPIIMRWLSRYQGSTTHTRLDRAVVARYFAFLVISQLIVFSLIGVIFNSVQEVMAQIDKHASFQDILQSLNKLPAVVHKTYISQSNYWLNWLPLRGFLAVFDLAQIINLVWVSFRTHVFGRTPRDIREWTQPPEFEYAIYYSNLLFTATVGLVFAPIAPLVTVGCAVVFWLSSVVYKYQLMFVFITKIESGGRLWNVVMNRLLASLILMQLLMTLTIILRLKFFSWIWISTLPPILFVFAFKFWLTKQFDNRFRWYLPSDSVVKKTTVHSANADNSGQRLEKRFGHPALYADLFTPMLHAKMVHLLPQVYHGNIGQANTAMDEYDGKKMQAQVLPGGIKIAGIEQSDLEYDPALYGRDRGELDWDRMSMHSGHMLGNAVHYARDKAQIPMNRIQGYLQHGPSASTLNHHPEHIELARMDSRQSDAWPLLQPNASQTGGLDSVGSTPYEHPHQYPPGVGYDRSGTPVQRAMTPLGQQPMTPQQYPQGHHGQAPSGSYSGLQPGQIFTPPQQQQAPPPHHRGLSVNTFAQYPPQGHHLSPSMASLHDRGPSATGDYFAGPRATSPGPAAGYMGPGPRATSPGPGTGYMGPSPVSPHQRMGTPQQHFSPRSQRQPSYDQLRQYPGQQPSPGGYRQ
ncbi:DUF221-domain-containing protein [Auriculariales sp. MPI-PUGE-AT-0066]|nr:DUF221-domain-containing protein [Auriculariales sp. MPI-PUGE-AT-0066]